MNQLKEIRETSFLDLNDISDHLSIPKLYLQAIEVENFSHLPKKKHLAEKYIISYADFLEVDVEPILEAYRHFQRPVKEYAPRSGKRQVTRSQAKSTSFWYTYRHYIWIGGICMGFVLLLWLIFPSEKSESIKSFNPSAQSETPVIPTHKERPIFTLQKSSIDSTVEQTWFISQADSIHVQIQSLGELRFRIWEDNVKGKMIVDKELSKGETFNLNGEKWVFIRLDDPSKAIMRVNDVVIDTVSQKTGSTFEFKIAPNKNHS